MRNLLYVRAALEDLPEELAGLADRVSVVLPWGSLLGAVARPCVSLLVGIRALCQTSAKLTVVFALDPDRYRSEAERLGLVPPVGGDLRSHLAPGYREAGFRIRWVRVLPQAELERWSSTWARRLARGRSRSLWELEATAD
jgi:16S rRNA (adenine(1408)-N(1))-methyltransferase